MLLSLGSQRTHTCCHCCMSVIAAGGPGLPPAVSLAGEPLFSLTPSTPAGSSAPSGSAPLSFLSSLSSLLFSTVTSPPITTKLKPLIYSPALPPVPAKALGKIRTNTYFALKELLPNNAALLQRLQELGHITTLTMQPNATVRLREINNPLTWIFCFLSFIAAKTDIEETCDLIAYAQIILPLTRQHGGAGWLIYDQQFRQQATGSALTPWREITNPLLSATVLTAQADAGAATRRLFALSVRAMTTCQPSRSTSKESLGKTTAGVPSRSQPRRRYAGLNNICRNFNYNACMADSCRYNHVCLLCSHPGHGARESGKKPKRKRKLGHHQMIFDHFQRVPGIPLRTRTHWPGHKTGVLHL